MSGPIKLLCLPGYLQNGKVFAEKSSGIRKMISKKLKYELDYVSPPVKIERKEDLAFILSEDEEEASKKWEEIVAQDLNRCWFQSGKNNMYDQMDESFKYLTEYITKNGPYQGVMGFSQGAAMAVMISNKINTLVPSHPYFKVAVIFSGFAFTESVDSSLDNTVNSITDLEKYKDAIKLNPKFEENFATHSETKIISIFGTSDNTVPGIRSRFLLSLYDPSIVHSFEQEGGHFIPNKKPFLTPIVDLVKEAIEN